MAHHPGPRVLGVLARRHRGVPHQRRHRRRGAALRQRHRRRGSSSGRSASNCWWRPRGCGGRWATTTGTAGSASTGSPVPTSTPRSRDDNVYTNLMAHRNLRRRGDAVRRHPDVARALGVDDEEAASWRDAATSMHIALRRASWAYTSRPRASPGYAGLGLRGHQARPLPAAAARTRTSTCTASRWSNRPTWCSPCTGAATRSPPRRRPATSPTTSSSPSATRRCRPARRRCWPPRSATWSWRTTTWARPR